MNEVVQRDALKFLSNQLESSCDELGNEKENRLDETSKIFHNMALQYKQSSPDKISLIKCVGLLNAAISRNCSNSVFIKSDLEKVCREILKLSGAKKQNANLVCEAESIRSQIEEMRTYVKSELSDIQRYISLYADDTELREYEENKAKSVSSLQNNIKTQYIDIMSRLSGICQDIMGEPPCKYAVVGMGSLARSEITPYSDFEHIIVLENGCEKRRNYPRILEYFRWFSVIFHVIILNLQETIIPSLDIDCLDWFYDKITKRGISFDGMMPHACKFPLGRQQPTKSKPWTTELIKPADKMLEFLSTEASLKEGYRLGHILTKTCFVSGEKELWANFKQEVKSYLRDRSEEITDLKKKQVNEDLRKFSIKAVLSDIRLIENINIKHFYRCATLFVAAHDPTGSNMASSCFDMIHSLFNQEVISEDTKHNLLYAVALACEIRLRCYMKEGRQADEMQIQMDGERNSKKLENILGAQNTIKYFQIVYCLQYTVANKLRLRKNHFYSNHLYLNIFLCCALESDKKMMLLLNKIKSSKKTKKNMLETDELFDLLETNMKVILEPSLSQTGWKQNDKAKALKEFGYKLIRNQEKDDSLLFFKCSYAIADQSIIKENMNPSPESDKLLKEAEKIKADSLIGQLQCMADDQISLDCSQEALEIYRRISSNPEEGSDLATALEFVGKSYLALNKKEKADQYFTMSSQVSEKLRNRGNKRKFHEFND